MNQSPLSSFFASRFRVATALAWAALLIFAVWVFSEMVDDTPKGEFRGWDEPVLKWVRGGPDAIRSAPAVVALVRGVTVLGSASALAVISAGVLAWLAWRRRWPAVTIFAVVAIGAPLATSALKAHFARTRPDIVPHLVSEESWSFPSGHALCSAAIYLTLSIVLARSVRSPIRQVALVGAGFLLSFLIGLSRIYLGVHYPTDVIAGWSAGTIWALVWCGVLLGWEHYTRPPTPKNSRD